MKQMNNKQYFVLRT